MKKLLIPAFAAILVLAGCQKKETGLSNGPGTFVFTSEKPTLSGTRTAWNGTSVEWSKGDAISMAYTVDDAWAGPGKLYVSDPLEEDCETAHFSVPSAFSGSGEGVHRFYAVYPAQTTQSFENAPQIDITVPQRQTPSAQSFDPAAELMTARSRDTYEHRPEGAVPLRWTRLTAHGDITLKNLDSESGETLESISFQAQKGANLAGKFRIDLTDAQNVQPIATTTAKNKITVLPDHLSLRNGQVRLWISIMPVTITQLTVTVETDRATYTKTFTGISKTFVQNARNILEISMNGASKKEAASVTTGGASDITTAEATLAATYTGDASYGGFEYGLTSSLGQDIQADLTGNGSFTARIDNLGDGKTYYYRAYIAVLEGSSYVYYYGDTKTFTTKAASSTVSVPKWFELPAMKVKASGSYLVNKSNSTQYFAWHYAPDLYQSGRLARNYTVCFSSEYHCPMWVAAPRHSSYTGSSGRTDAYQADPDIPSGIQYSSKSTGGGCNKGHMLGSAERTATKATNRQVFYYSNIAPQLSSGFNTGGGGWNLLEDYVDSQVCADTLYEVVGCYFKQYTDGYGMTASPKTISFGGRSDVAMPTMFYYVLLRTKKGNSGKSVKDCSASELQCVAFVRTHTNSLKGQKPSAKELMSVSDLERITGFTYFANVPNAPKSTYSASDWGL